MLAYTKSTIYHYRKPYVCLFIHKAVVDGVVEFLSGQLTLDLVVELAAPKEIQRTSEGELSQPVYHIMQIYEDYRLSVDDKVIFHNQELTIYKVEEYPDNGYCLYKAKLTYGTTH